ncbi:MAG: energy transducer TonB [Sphingobacteriales bacterium JAD_PAG50586_3]|nr:MAG: energy transducer TonB [Sphingobacteriales bacterium JAD_PAG50586_3]
MLAKNVNSFDDLVFENRNKSYGAYAIRKGYNNSMAKAFGSTALLLMLLLLIATRSPEIKDIVLNTGSTPPTDIVDDIVPPEPVKPQNNKAEKVATQATNDYDVNGKREIIIQPIDPKKSFGTINQDGVDRLLNKDDIYEVDDTTGTGGKGPAKPVDTYTPVYTAQVMPKFPGGEPAMMNFISEQARKNRQWSEMGLSGTIYVQFIVGVDGTVSHVEAVRGSYDLLKKTAVNAVKSMPKWAPGMQDGRAVPVILVVPISFKQI